MTSAEPLSPDLDPASRVDPPGRGNEVDTLLGFLRYHRNTFRWKTGGLNHCQLATTLPPSDMTLGGMIKHLALVEIGWFHEFFAGNEEPEPWASVDWENDPDWEWRTAREDSPAQLSEIYERCVRMADEAIAQRLSDDGMDTMSARTDGRTQQPFTLRWIVTHMIEEYARHNGHADLIRQSIDGRVGE